MPDNSSQKSFLPDRPFRLCTTSFIYPGGIISNIKKTGPFFDEIELLILESIGEKSLPSKNDVKELLHLSEDLNLTFNVHLPLDICVTDFSALKRKTASDTILRVVDLFEPLKPTTHTLHLDLQDGVKTGKDLIEWEKRGRQSLENILSDISDPRAVSVETLDYPVEYLENFLREFNLSVCIDAGHILKYNYNLLDVFHTYKSRTPVIHLHGVDFSGQKIRDHSSLDRTPEDKFGQMLEMLRDYSGVVSLEVFSIENLDRSLRHLSGFFKNIRPLKALNSGHA